MHDALHQEVMTPIRAEYASGVAVCLRALLSKDSRGIPLIQSSGHYRKMLFPLINVIGPFNQLPGTDLVGMTIIDNQCMYRFDGEVIPKDKVPYVLLAYDDWMDEVVCDFKLKDYPPLSRAELIKIVADKTGAHFDVDIEKNINLIETHNVMPLRFFVGDNEAEADTSNLFTEIILSIASELLYAHDYFKNPRPIRMETSDKSFIIYDYSDKKHKRLKYLYIRDGGVNLINTNPYFDCSISKKMSHLYRVKFRDRIFKLAILDQSFSVI